MTPKSQKEMSNGQINFNTVLLAVCVGLSGWALKSIEDLKTTLAGQIPITNANSSSISNINKVDDEQSKQIETHDNRITTLEILVRELSKNKK